MRTWKTTITVKDDDTECTIIVNHDLEKSIKAFIVAMQSLGYSRELVIDVIGRIYEENTPTDTN